MKLHLIAAASAALLIAAPIGSVEAQVAQAIESQREESFLEQALDYRFEAENAQVFADKEKDNKKSNDKKKDNFKKKNDPEPTRKPKQTPKPTKKPKRTPKPTKKPKRTPEPTRKPKCTRKPTPRPTRRPTVSRRQANRLISREWSTGECTMRRRRQSSRCRDLNDGVCSMSERSIIRRFSEEAVEVCNKVSLPPDTDDYDNGYEVVESEFDSKPMYEDEDYEYDNHAAASSSSSTSK